MKDASYLKELVPRGRASARNEDGLAVGASDTITVTRRTRIMVSSEHRYNACGTHPVPSGLTPDWTPNCGPRFGSTSLLIGTDTVEAAYNAAADKTKVANFIVESEDKQQGIQVKGKEGGEFDQEPVGRMTRRLVAAASTRTEEYTVRPAEREGRGGELSRG